MQSAIEKIEEEIEKHQEILKHFDSEYRKGLIEGYKDSVEIDKECMKKIIEKLEKEIEENEKKDLFPCVRIAYTKAYKKAIEIIKECEDK